MTENTLHGSSEASAHLVKVLAEVAQSMADAFEQAARASIPLDQQQQMSAVELGGSGVAGAITALLTSTTQAANLPNLEAMAFTVGAAFAPRLLNAAPQEVAKALIALGKGVAHVMVLHGQQALPNLLAGMATQGNA